MKLINAPYLLTGLLAMTLFSQASNAIVITNYTALYDDGSKLVVDLKGYDYDVGSHFASSPGWDDEGLGLPPVESFGAFFYPSWGLQQRFGFEAGKIGNTISGTGLHFTVGTNYSVSMNSFVYMQELPDWSVASNGIHIQNHIEPYDYHVDFKGGLSKPMRRPLK